MKQLFSRNGTAGSKDGDPSRTGEQTSGQGFPQLIAWRVLPNPHQEKRNPSRAERIPIEMEWRAQGELDPGEEKAAQTEDSEVRGSPSSTQLSADKHVHVRNSSFGGEGKHPKEYTETVPGTHRGQEDCLFPAARLRNPRMEEGKLPKLNMESYTDNNAQPPRSL